MGRKDSSFDTRRLAGSASIKPAMKMELLSSFESFLSSKYPSFGQRHPRTERLGCSMDDYFDACQQIAGYSIERHLTCKPLWLYRSISLRLNDISIDKIEAFLEKKVRVIQEMKLYCDGMTQDRLSHFADCFHGAPRLRELVLSGNCVIDAVFPSLLSAPFLEKLDLQYAMISSPWPVRRFLASTKTLRTLRLKSVATKGDKDRVAKAFRQGLRKNGTLKELTLNDVQDDNFLAEILYGLVDHDCVAKLAISFEKGRFSQQGAQAFWHVLGTSTTLDKVTLSGDSWVAKALSGLGFSKTVRDLTIHAYQPDDSGNQSDLDAVCAASLKNLFNDNKTLRSLTFESCKFGNAACFALAAGLERSNTIDEICLDNVGFSFRSPLTNHLDKIKSLSSYEDYLANQEIISVVSGSSNLQKLCLRDCEESLSEATTLQVINRTRGTSLEYLDLSWSPIRTENCKEVLRAACESCSLKVLKLSRTGTDLNECSSELEMLLVKYPVKELYLNGNDGIQESCAMAIAKGLKRDNCLLEILSLPVVADRASHAILGEALTHNQSLQALVDYTSNVAAGEDSLISFISFLPKMQGLKKLDIEDNELTQKEQDALLSSLAQNTTLEHLRTGSLDSELAQFYLSLNRFGRRFLEPSEGTAPLKPSLWPLVLARMGRFEYSSELFYFLRAKVDLLCHEPSRKRKL